MPLFWFLAGMLTTLAAVGLLRPWLRRMPRFAALPALPWATSVALVLIVAAILGLYRWLAAHPDVPQGPAVAAGPAAAASAVSGTVVSGFSDAARAFDGATGSPEAPAKTGAGSMESAIANLEARLAKDGGSADDWELLAKSFEFLHRPVDAAKARARQLPPLPTPPETNSAGESGGAVLSGEVTLSGALRSKVAAGDTLFIIARAVDAPGPPVAVLRTRVGSWPLKFTLDDSLSMLPGRNLSSAGPVTIEARISQHGQPLPASGDLQGSTGVIDPADHRPLKITIDQVIT
jgi:hypothetical protein